MAVLEGHSSGKIQVISVSRPLVNLDLAGRLNPRPAREPIEFHTVFSFTQSILCNSHSCNTIFMQSVKYEEPPVTPDSNCLQFNPQNTNSVQKPEPGVVWIACKLLG